MAEFFGDLERLAADLYPYRWLVAASVLAVLGAMMIFAYRQGWDKWIWQRKVPVVIVGTPMLALVIFIGYDLGSPLFTNKTVEEEFPFAFSASIPEDMEISDVEMIMAGMAKVDQEFTEGMEDMMEVTAAKLKSGNLRDADSFHKGSGQAVIYRGPDGSHVLRLENLNVTNGPDLHVILTPHQSPMRRGDVMTPGYADLGKLKGNKGNQNYAISDDVDIDLLGSVVIYCKPFHVVFSVATLIAEG